MPKGSCKGQCLDPCLGIKAGYAIFLLTYTEYTQNNQRVTMLPYQLRPTKNTPFNTYAAELSFTLLNGSIGKLIKKREMFPRPASYRRHSNHQGKVLCTDRDTAL